MQTLQDKMAKLSPERRQKIETLTAELVNEEHRHDIERTEQASNVALPVTKIKPV